MPSNKLLLSVLWVMMIISVLAPRGAQAVDEPALKAEAMKLVKSFAKGLGGHLQSAIEEGGANNAIPVCNVKAPIVAGGLSTNGWTVARTSLKIRNPANAPAPWQMRVLMDFETKAAGGIDPKSLADARVQTLDGKQVYTFMKAIPTAKLCLTCHGENIDAAVVASLDELYPTDQARGYKVGDIRGAFVLTKSLD